MPRTHRLIDVGYLTLNLTECGRFGGAVAVSFEWSNTDCKQCLKREKDAREIITHAPDDCWPTAEAALDAFCGVG